MFVILLPGYLAGGLTETVGCGLGAGLAAGCGAGREACGAGAVAGRGGCGDGGADDDGVGDDGAAPVDTGDVGRLMTPPRGEMIISMRRPSIIGGCSTIAMSDVSSTTFLSI